MISSERAIAAGNLLIVFGVGMWGVYAAGRYVLGWGITDRDFLPYHLAAIIPGMALRYHRCMAGWIRDRLSGKRKA